MAVTLTAGELKTAVRAGVTSSETEIITRLLQVATERVEAYAPNAPEATQNEAVVRFAGYLYDQPTSSSARFDYSAAFRNSGAASLLLPWRVHAARNVQDAAAAAAEAADPGNPVVSVAVQGSNLVVTKLDGTVNTYPLPAGGGPGGGLNQAAVDARIEAGVQEWARDEETPIPAGKLANAPSSEGGEGGGVSLEETAPTWPWYMAVKESRDYFTAADFVGADGTMSTGDEIVSPAKSGSGEKFLAYAIPYAARDYDSLHFVGETPAGFSFSALRTFERMNHTDVFINSARYKVFWSRAFMEPLPAFTYRRVFKPSRTLPEWVKSGGDEGEIPIDEKTLAFWGIGRKDDEIFAWVTMRAEDQFLSRDWVRNRLGRAGIGVTGLERAALNRGSNATAAELLTSGDENVSASRLSFLFGDDYVSYGANSLMTVTRAKLDRSDPNDTNVWYMNLLVVNRFQQGRFFPYQTLILRPVYDSTFSGVRQPDLVFHRRPGTLSFGEGYRFDLTEFQLTERVNLEPYAVAGVKLKLINPREDDSQNRVPATETWAEVRNPTIIIPGQKLPRIDFHAHDDTGVLSSEHYISLGTVSNELKFFRTGQTGWWNEDAPTGSRGLQWAMFELGVLQATEQGSSSYQALRFYEGKWIDLHLLQGLPHNVVGNAIDEKGFRSNRLQGYELVYPGAASPPARGDTYAELRIYLGRTAGPDPELLMAFHILGNVFLTGSSGLTDNERVAVGILHTPYYNEDVGRHRGDMLP